MNWSCWPLVMVVFCGLRVIAVSVLLLIVSGDAAEAMLPDVAVIFVVPNATAVARPVVLMVATLGDDDVQVTCVFTFPVVLLPKVPVAVYC